MMQDRRREERGLQLQLGRDHFVVVPLGEGALAGVEEFHLVDGELAAVGLDATFDEGQPSLGIGCSVLFPQQV